MRIAIADDSPHLRAGLRALAVSVGAEVVAAVSRGGDLVDAVAEAPADAPVQVALADMRMPPTYTDEGLRAARRIRALRPATAVLVFSADDEAPYAAEVLGTAPGGMGYVLKSTLTDRDQMRSALTRLVAGDTVIDVDVARRLLNRPGRAPLLTALDDRQRAALLLALQGRTVNGAALLSLRAALGVPPPTGAGGPDGEFIARDLVGWLLAHG